MGSITLGAVAVVFSAVVGAAVFATSFGVARRAADTAGPSPYCIQIPDAADYRQAVTLFDLSGFRMWAKSERGLSLQHHAILVVGAEFRPDLFHWSYRRRDFVRGVINERTEGYGPVITCEPRAGFADGLPLLSAENSDTDYVRFSSQEAYRIPKAYQARWSSGASRSLRLVTAAPEFLPLAMPLDRLTVAERDANSIFVDWQPAWLLRLMAWAPRGTMVEEGSEYGMLKTKIVSRGRDAKDHVSTRYLVHADEQTSGVNTTLIGCSMPVDAFPRSCQHRFLNKGRHFYFRHRPEDVRNWRAMQARVLDMFASFEVRKR